MFKGLIKDRLINDWTSVANFSGRSMDGRYEQIQSVCPKDRIIQLDLSTSDQAISVFDRVMRIPLAQEDLIAKRA